MNKRYKKVSLIFILLFIIFSSFIVRGNPIDDINPIEPSDGMNELNTIRNTIFVIIKTIGAGISVITLVILGIKFMYSSPNDRAEIKKYLLIYVVGAVIFWGAIGIVDLIKGFGKEII